jgi:hypothetical protein
MGDLPGFQVSFGVRFVVCVRLYLQSSRQQASPSRTFEIFS